MTIGAKLVHPADMLTGITLEDGWYVESLIIPGPKATGGHFSSSYRVTRGKEVAFLKALDYVAALNDEDPPQALASLTAAFLFERDLLHRCGIDKMQNVVRILADGSVEAPGAGAISKVSYLIFEMADGDIRHFRAVAGRLDTAWTLRTLHNAACGLQQLHQGGVAHQDMKPSNLLVFDEGELAKLGDLGCASVQGMEGPRDHHLVAGDGTYAPPEALYGFTPTDWSARRRACDLFHLGSMLLFLFTESTATAALFAQLDNAYWPAVYGGGWVGSYDEVTLYLRDALGRVAAYLPDVGDEHLNEQIGLCFRQLCEPDPCRRGHPKNHAELHGDSYSVVRYVSIFNALAARAERALAETVLG